MYCAYRVKMEEYKPGLGWKDDGYIYSTHRHLVEQERDRRLITCYSDTERTRAGSIEIVIMHETFLRDLCTTPVLSSLKGTHPADQGLLSSYKKTIRKPSPDYVLA